MSEIITFKLTKYIWTYSQTFDCLMVGNLLFCSFALRSFHREQIALIALYKRIDLKKQAIRSKKFVFFVCFSLLFPFLCPSGNPSRCSSLFTKEQPWAIRRFSRADHSVTLFQERIALSLFFKSESLFRSFPRVNCSFALFQEWIALSLTKMSDSLEKTKSKSPTLDWLYQRTAKEKQWHINVLLYNC